MFYNFLQTLLSDIKMKLENVTKLENETKALDSLRKQMEEHNKELEETMEEVTQCVKNVWTNMRCFIFLVTKLRKIMHFGWSFMILKLIDQRFMSVRSLWFSVRSKIFAQYLMYSLVFLPCDFLHLLKGKIRWHNGRDPKYMTEP